MTDDEVQAYMNSPEFRARIESDEMRQLCATFDARLDAGEFMTMQEAASHFSMPFSVFRIVFADFLARAEMTLEPGTRQ